MKNILILIACLLSAHLQSQNPQDEQRIPSMDSIKIRINNFVEKNNIPALTVAIIQDGKVDYILNGNTSRKNGQPISENSVFQIASLSKTFTAIIANNLIEQGAIELKNSIANYLEDDLPSEVLARINYITIQDLLHHRAGFPHDGKSLPPSPNGGPQKELYTKEMLIKDLSNMKLDPKVEKRFSYSNFGYALLGLIMERASGKPYKLLLRDYVIKPYELINTTVAEKSVRNGLN